MTELLAYLKKEEISTVDVCGLVSIEMDSAPGIDLSKIPKDMRCQRESVAEKDRKNNRLLHHMDGVTEGRKL